MTKTYYYPQKRLEYIRSEKAKELARKRSKKYRESHKEKIREHNKSLYDTVQKKARRKFNNKSRYNREILLNYCEICGETKNIQAHHFDYDKPLKTIHLCVQHHRDIHKYFNLLIKKYGEKS